MTLLKEAVREQAAAKIGLFGGQGSGKSLTSLLIAIGLSKTYHKGAPIALFDTEAGSDWLLDICEAEKVKTYRHKGRAFSDMRQFRAEAEKSDVCALVIDSYTHPWVELQTALKATLSERYKTKVIKLEFHHMQELRDLWNAWVVEMLNSRLHVLMAGRLGFEWENDEDLETGKIGFHKAGTKLRGEGDAGYEPHLLLEMEQIRELGTVEQVRQGKKVRQVRKQAKAGGSYLHRMHVLKDRSRALNGRAFDFRDMNGYPTDGWQPVFNTIKPHLDRLIHGAKAVHVGAGDQTRTSGELFDGNGNTDLARRAKRVAIVLEEIQGAMTKLWPGQDAASKRQKVVVLEAVFQTRSWTAVESAKLETLDLGLDVLKYFEEKVGDGQFAEALTNDKALAAALGVCRDQVLKSADELARATEELPM